jgi:hypothetical protein
MMVIVTAVVFRGVAVEPSLRGDPTHVFSFIRPGIFQAIGVISFAVSYTSLIVEKLWLTTVRLPPQHHVHISIY